MKLKKLTGNDAVFIYYSIRERLCSIKFCEHFSNDFTLTDYSQDDLYASWDVVIERFDKLKLLAEIKVRDRDSNQFTKEGWIFELIKYDGMMHITTGKTNSDINIEPVYLNFLNDCALMWKIKSINRQEFKPDLFRKSSVSGSMDKGDKDVVYLDINDAERYELKMDVKQIDNDAMNIFRYRYPNSVNELLKQLLNKPKWKKQTT